ncbi:MAG TPA: SRPBCC domain-containing protein [Acidimicrobiales bacterium]|nr:SRPBCC domain-containing protein [Acidimicrobiales bacterium]
MTHPTHTTELGELTVTRVFDAPREMVFGAMLDPEQLTHFWGPIGSSTPIEGIVIEPWPGGRFETTMVPDGSPIEAGFVMKAVFVEVVAPEHIVFKQDLPTGEMTTASTYTDLGAGRTRVVIHQTNLPPEFTTDEAQAGFNSSLDRLESYLATRTR